MARKCDSPRWNNQTLESIVVGALSGHKDYINLVENSKAKKDLKGTELLFAIASEFYLTQADLLETRPALSL